MQKSSLLVGGVLTAAALLGVADRKDSHRQRSTQPKQQDQWDKNDHSHKVDTLRVPLMDSYVISDLGSMHDGDRPLFAVVPKLDHQSRLCGFRAVEAGVFYAADAVTMRETIRGSYPAMECRAIPISMLQDIASYASGKNPAQIAKDVASIITIFGFAPCERGNRMSGWCNDSLIITSQDVFGHGDVSIGLRQTSVGHDSVSVIECKFANVSVSCHDINDYRTVCESTFDYTNERIEMIGVKITDLQRAHPVIKIDSNNRVVGQHVSLRTVSTPHGNAGLKAERQGYKPWFKLNQHAVVLDNYDKDRIFTILQHKHFTDHLNTSDVGLAPILVLSRTS